MAFHLVFQSPAGEEADDYQVRSSPPPPPPSLFGPERTATQGADAAEDARRTDGWTDRRAPQLAYPLLSQVSRLAPTFAGEHPLVLRTRTFDRVTLLFQTDPACAEAFETVRERTVLRASSSSPRRGSPFSPLAPPPSGSRAGAPSFIIIIILTIMRQRRSGQSNPPHQRTLSF